MATFPAYGEYKVNVVGGDQGVQVTKFPLTGGVKVGQGMHVIMGADGFAAPTTGSDSAGTYLGLCSETVDNSTAGLGNGSSSVSVWVGGRVRVFTLNGNLAGATSPAGKIAYVSTASSGAEFCLSGGAAGTFDRLSGSTGGSVLTVPVNAVACGYVEKIHGDGSAEIVLRVVPGVKNS